MSHIWFKIFHYYFSTISGVTQAIQFSHSIPSLQHLHCTALNEQASLYSSTLSQLLDAYFSRAHKEQKEKFLKNHGFSLLANQLYIHQGSQGLLECFLEMLFGRPVGLEEE